LNSYLLDPSLRKNKNHGKRKEVIKSFNKVKSRLRNQKPSEIFSFLSFLEKSFRISVPANLISEQFLSLNDIMELEGCGWTIGNHTYNHPNLARLTHSEIRREIEMTHESLGRFRSYRKVLALPFGDQPAYSSRVIDAAKESGISHVFTTICRVNELQGPTGILHRIAPETLSLDYFKFLVQGKKTRIQQTIRKVFN
jgi:hypothetical protein